MAAPGGFYSLNLPAPPRNTRRNFPSSSTGLLAHQNSSTHPRFPSSTVIKSAHSTGSSTLSSKNPKPSAFVPEPTTNPNPSKPLVKILKSTLVVGATAALLLGGGGISNSGGGGGGGGGWGGGQGGNFWSRFWSRVFPPPATAKDDDPSSKEWDSHGLPVNIVAQLNKLSGFKKYKLSDIVFFDRRRGSTTEGTEDSFFEMVTIRPGGIYTKAQLQKELETLAGCGMFEKVDLDAKTNADGTIGVKISFLESTWPSADKFRCINVGLMAQSKPIEMDPDMTEKEKIDFYRSQEKDYRRRMDRARPCLLPLSAQREIVLMLRERGAVSARLLQKIRDSVQQWYHDNGYACAQVVNFGNLNTKEVVCEVVEGDITQLVIQFQDKLGNVCEGNTQLAVVRRELPRKVSNALFYFIHLLHGLVFIWSL